MEQAKLIDLNKVANGALLEMVNLESQKVFDNIADVNTKETAKRGITIQLDFTPDKQRNVINVEITVKSKLAGRVGTSTNFLVGEDSNGKVVGGEMKSEIPGQLYINGDGDVADDFGNKIEENQESEKVANLFK